MKILNLFAGIGGNRTLWGDEHEITAIENNQQIACIYHKRFPNDAIIIQDAYEYLVENYKRFDFIWCSPPCITHTNLCHPIKKKRLPDMRLYSLIIFLNTWFRGDWVVENVKAYYAPLIKPAAKIDRHLIWSNIPLSDKKKARSGNIKDLNLKILCQYLRVDFDMMNEIKLKNWSNHDGKRQVLRNCVLPEVGKYILDSIKTITLDNFSKQTI